MEYLEAEAKQKQREAGRFEGKNPNGTPKEKFQLEVNSPQAEKIRQPQARDKAAAMVGVGGQAVQRAKAIAVEPDLKDKVQSGQSSLNAAYGELKRREAQRQQADPQPKAATSKEVIYLVSDRQMRIGIRFSTGE